METGRDRRARSGGELLVDTTRRLHYHVLSALPLPILTLHVGNYGRGIVKRSTAHQFIAHLRECRHHLRVQAVLHVVFAGLEFQLLQECLGTLWRESTNERLAAARVARCAEAEALLEVAAGVWGGLHWDAHTRRARHVQHLGSAE